MRVGGAARPMQKNADSIPKPIDFWIESALLCDSIATAEGGRATAEGGRATNSAFRGSQGDAAGCVRFEFFSEHNHIWRGFYSYLHAVSGNSHYRNDNGTAELNSLVFAAR